MTLFLCFWTRQFFLVLDFRSSFFFCTQEDHWNVCQKLVTAHGCHVVIHELSKLMSRTEDLEGLYICISPIIVDLWWCNCYKTLIQYWYIGMILIREHLLYPGSDKDWLFTLALPHGIIVVVKNGIRYKISVVVLHSKQNGFSLLIVSYNNNMFRWC